MTKPRVLHVINGLQTGGAESLLFRLVTQRSEFEHEVIALAGRDWYSPLLEQHGIRVHHLGVRSPLSLVRGIASLDRIIASRKPDLVQCWMYSANLIGGLVARRHGLPVIWAIHSSSLDGLGRATRLSARLGGLLSSRLTDRILNCSSRSAELHEPIGYAREISTVVHNGYDATAFFPDSKLRSAVRRDLGVDSGTFAIGCIARWNSRKNVPNLLEALRLLKERQVRIQCLLIGRDLEMSNPELAAALERLGCSEMISALGERLDLDTLCRALDLHVLPSATEAFPNVVAETMLSATPNVVTDVGDAALIVGDTGWVVPPHDPPKLADAMETAYREWSEQPEIWEKRRVGARERVAELFTFERMAEGYERVWLKAIAQRDRRGVPQP